MTIDAIPATTPSIHPAPQPVENAEPENKKNHTYKRPGWLNTLVDLASQKAVLTPEGASPAYFKEPVKRNEALDNYGRSYTPIKSANEITSEQVKAHIEEKFGFTNIDPEKTFLVTIVFNDRGDKEPNKGVITQKISLTEAARRNIQGTHLPYFSGPDSRSQYDDGPPRIEIDNKSRHTTETNANGEFSTAENFTYNKWFQGIYLEPYSGAPNTYDASNYVPIAPKEFQQMVWDNAYKQPYDNYLKDYWNANTRAEFTGTATVTYLTAAHIQHHDKSLTENDRKIAMGVAGVPPDKTYLSVTPEELKQPYKADPNLETKFLTFSGFETRMFYTRDKTTQRTLLYVPGDFPPLHAFDSVEAMNRALGEALKDPQRAQMLKLQFRPEDRPDYGRWVGADARIDVTSKRLNQYLSEEELENSGFWKEGGAFDGHVIEGNPFEELQYRTEKASKAAIDQQFVLNSDHTKTQVLGWLRIASYALLLFAPLGMAFPPVGVALTAAATGIGGAELGIGIDDKIHNRPGADNRIFSGILNTVKPVLTEGFGIAFKPVSGAIKQAMFKP